jgi:hypothetical protein
MPLYVYAADVKEGNLPKFREWAPEGEKRLGRAAPKGWKLRGIFLTSYGLGAHQTEIHWEVEEFAAFDRASELYQEGGDYARAVDEYYSFVDLGSGRARVLRAAADRNLQLARAAGAAALGL